MKNRKNILIVDDSKIRQKMLKRLLEKEGFSVFAAPTVSDGFKIMGSEDIGIVLIDYYLAGFNTGDAMVHKLRRYKVDVKIYSISSSEEMNQELLIAGCDGIISGDAQVIKNFLIEKFLEDIIP